MLGTRDQASTCSGYLCSNVLQEWAIANLADGRISGTGYSCEILETTYTTNEKICISYGKIFQLLYGVVDQKIYQLLAQNYVKVVLMRFTPV